MSQRLMVVGEAEMEKLAGVSDIQFRLYFALRWRMDSATGMVGARNRISYQALAEELEVWAIQGRNKGAGKPSKQAIRSALSYLEKIGLVEQQETYADLLIFKLNLAVLKQVRSKEEQHMSNTKDKHGFVQQKNQLNHDVSGVIHRDEQQPIIAIEQHTSTTNKPNISVVNNNTTETTSSKNEGGDVVGVLSAGEIEKHLRHWEARRGKVFRCERDDQSIKQLAARSIEYAELRACYEQAVALREKKTSPHAVNAGLILSICSASVKRDSVSKGVEGARAREWFNDPSALAARARELGISGQCNDESYASFRSRVMKTHFEAASLAKKPRAARRESTADGVTAAISQFPFAIQRRLMIAGVAV